MRVSYTNYILVSCVKRVGQRSPRARSTKKIAGEELLREEAKRHDDHLGEELLFREEDRGEKLPREEKTELLREEEKELLREEEKNSFAK